MPHGRRLQMDFQGQQFIPADRETVWNALNDPEILKLCIPGCQELFRISDDELEATALLKIGPVSARFLGTVRLSDLDPPNGYRISGEGQGGVAGFARGDAVVRLEVAKDGTLLHYSVSAQIGGKISQLGGRLLEATAKKIAGSFFQKFEQEIRTRTNNIALELTNSVDDRAANCGRGKPARVHPNRIIDTRKEQDAVKQNSSLATDRRPNLSHSLKLIAAAGLGGAIMFAWLQFTSLSTNRPTILLTETNLSPEFLVSVQLIMAVLLGYLLGARR